MVPYPAAVLRIPAVDGMKTADVRAAFLKFFEARDHKIVASDSLIPSTDPTLLFTSAGMVQFKPHFQNPASSPYKRAASCQKCLRTSDIERVGYTMRHLTFFEMLGNFSFGDYFKKESIAWGWEFFTQTMGLPGDRFVVSVFKEDDEAFNIWEKLIPKNKIYRLNEDTNFWNMGPTGPCGPCSEILWDRGAEWSCGKPDCGPACDCDRYLEVWNHVFTQFDRTADGKLNPLPSKNIDTGMGLERISLLMQGASSPFGLDVFKDLCQAMAVISKRPAPTPVAKPRPFTESEARFYRIADHARAVTFMVNDGILPSNEGRGYVLRRLLRQAVRAGDALSVKEPFLFKLTGSVIDAMKEAYPELVQRRATIASIVKAEEEKFLETLEIGTRKLKELVTVAQAKKIDTLPGKDLFQLYDTYGFPFELTREMAEGLGFKVDSEGFKQAQEALAKIARQGWKGSGAQDVDRYRRWKDKLKITTPFIGYDLMHIETKIAGSLYLHQNDQWSEVIELKAGQEGEIVVLETPMYPEGGGQVGDQGGIETADGQALVLDTQTPVEQFIVHRVKVEKGVIKAGAAAKAIVNPITREATMRHHTATHLLHKALREVLGTHVTQAGSLVAPDRLRFDFNHNAPLTPEQRKKVEDLVNGQILNDVPVRACHMTKDKAQQIGAMMLFGEKYGTDVRTIMVTHEDCSQPQAAWSLELCGGTHVHATGKIGMFKIVSQASVSAGIRRIEAVAGHAAIQSVRRMEQQLHTLAESLKTTPDELAVRAEKLLAHVAQLEKELQQHKSGALKDQFENIAKTATKVGDFRVISQSLDGGDEKQLREISDRLKDGKHADVIVLGAAGEEKASFVVSVSKDGVAKGLNAGKLAKELSALLQGQGGGRPDFAQGGGKNIAALPGALKDVPALIKKVSPL
jgi:alanyl-tRNA synthetase